ncbi:hypothetical protein ABL78_3643 [Leptomonas seymouri]|uniref:BSD domain-containing protein n=1 Tax=Leptomonas seymouri TaxID=5684 RepID=A0A0N1PC05_LEPSE|nr:hypothetical protein ABL78_3643 [Leptomonas seymouri]|eukprot:KPI87248.1 hypothetical protein ABL78_3643 [Leptomonas seymouri]
MWSMLSQDFMGFAEAFKSESADFVDYLGNIAADVVGRGDVYAGDEMLKAATQSRALSAEQLRRLQEAASTYTLAIQPSEEDAFVAWMKTNPLSSRNAQRLLAEISEDPLRGSGGSPPGKAGAESLQSKPAAMTPSRRSTEWPDEPIDEIRQRLLDYNDTVLQQYMALVGDAVNPRSSLLATPATPDTRCRLIDPSFAVKLDGDSNDADAAGAKGGEEGKPSATAEERVKPPLAPSTPPPLKAAPSTGRAVSEDDFFDRYFFRLAQLRISEAQRCRDRKATPNASDASSLSGSAKASRRTSTQSPSPQTQANDPSCESNDDDFAAVPLFAKRMMTAASGFVTNIDNALNKAVSSEISRCSGEGVYFRGAGSDDESANVDPSELAHFRGPQQQISDLESLVQCLQEALRRERRRVQQLTTELEAHNIAVPPEVPASAASTPAKGVAAAVAPECHVNPTPVSFSSAAVAETKTAERLQRGGVDNSLAAPIASPAKSTAGVAAVHRAPATTGKENDVVSASSENDEEDDEAWVSVNPSAEQGTS